MNAVSQRCSSAMRVAQERWAITSITQRLSFLRVLRNLIAENALVLATTAAAPGARPAVEKLVSEVLPLADACRWLERNAARVLAPRRHGWRGRPFWLHGVSFEVQRQPFGIVLVIGPRNYPLFLPAVQVLHALVAGNAVRLKPAPGTRQVMLGFAGFAFEAGLDPELLEILDDGDAEARQAIEEGAGKVIFTGGSETGRNVLAQLAATCTPSVMELSGKDAVLVLPDADLDLVERALRFGAELNAGNSCIAPRRVLAWQETTGQLSARLPQIQKELVTSDAEAIRLINSSGYALGASIFSCDVVRARRLAAQIESGFVLINDLIVPTADPRMPFSGVKASGFGTTRGGEGLLEMTFPHVVGERKGRSHLHFSGITESDTGLFFAYLRAAHGRHRIFALADLFGALIRKMKTQRFSS